MLRCRCIKVSTIVALVVAVLIVVIVLTVVVVVVYSFMLRLPLLYLGTTGSMVGCTL